MKATESMVLWPFFWFGAGFTRRPSGFKTEKDKYFNKGKKKE